MEKRRCPTCGKTLMPRNKKYCSRECRYPGYHKKRLEGPLPEGAYKLMIVLSRLPVNGKASINLRELATIYWSSIEPMKLVIR